MITLTAPSARDRLLDRRHRLRRTIDRAGRETAGDLVRLLDEVDAALVRADAGTYGLCEVCHEPMTRELERHPMGRYCLCDLSPAQLRALESDLETAASIQVGLLPPEDLSLAGWRTHFRYRPAGPVSGDLVELVGRPDGSLWFLLGDVAGKGVSAALVMAHVTARFRSLIEAERPLPAIVSTLGEELVGRTAPARYVTLVAGRAGADGQLEVANAGHVPPLLARSGGIERLGATGLPAGMFAGSEYGVHSRTTAPGDALLLYTDGLVESGADEGAEYGVDGLAHDLAVAARHAPEQLGAHVLASAAAFRGGRAALDDETLLVLRRE